MKTALWIEDWHRCKSDAGLEDSRPRRCYTCIFKRRTQARIPAGSMVVITISQRKYSMVHYEIKQYTLEQAKKYRYIVMLSMNKKKKLDV